MLRLPFFPGCALQTSAKSYLVSGLAVARKLEIELVELKKWNCCGVFSSMTNDDIMRQLAPIRNLVQVQEMNKKGIVTDSRTVTFCSMCYNTLKQATLFTKNEIKLKKVNDFLERERGSSGGIREKYAGGVQIINFLEVLRDIVGYKKIAENVKRPLNGLKVSPYYGCFVVRPKEIAIDDSQNPIVLENVLEALGAEVIYNPKRTQCCGSFHVVNRKDIVAKLVLDNLAYPIENGADLIATCCPLCTFNLETQMQIPDMLRRNLRQVPAVYYTQLMAIAFGLENSYQGFGLPFQGTDPIPILASKSLINQFSKEKFKG